MKNNSLKGKKKYREDKKRSDEQNSTICLLRRNSCFRIYSTLKLSLSGWTFSQIFNTANIKIRLVPEADLTFSTDTS